VSDPLADPDVVAALRRIGVDARRRADLCPGCGTVDLDAGEDLCRRCTDRAAASAERRARESKSAWWREQSDYSTLRAKHGALAGAERWLYHRLRKRQDGATTREMWEAADAAGITRMTFRRARARLVAAGRVEIRLRGRGRDRDAVWVVPGSHEPDNETSSGPRR
jgi:hypothetical protein